MNNIDKAAQVIREHDSDGACGEPECLAQDLADAGLLMPDLPEPDWLNSFDTKADGETTFCVTAHKGDVMVEPNWESEYENQAYVGVLAPTEARRLALALMAAAQHAEKEQA